MWRQVSISEAVSILLAGGLVHDGFYRWSGAIQLACPHRWRAKARKRKELARKLRLGRWNTGDGWWVYDK